MARSRAASGAVSRHRGTRDQHAALGAALVASEVVGRTPEMAGATVVGDTDDPKPPDGRRIGGRVVGQVFGGALAGPVWRDAPAGTFTPAPLP
ncbi:hypothetical protein [Kitasatospora sp. NPDC088548]|uniref:hypothetical protein n=1 Tax=Kitasatospora sp. NPDC088548 TaxID=3364075 RepID=UPI0038242F7F